MIGHCDLLIGHSPLMFHWLIHTHAGFIARLIAGALFFLSLALWDLHKRGRDATRWKEYVFLLACVFVAMLYGVVNDQITSAISWEYFYYGKELEAVLGPATPPDRAAMQWQAAKIGMMATWSVGLILGVALLIANNPRRTRPQISYPKMLAMLPAVLLVTIAGGILFGIAGWFGWLNWVTQDFRDMWATGIFRPNHFIAAWGAHLGGYIGGLIGGAAAVMRIVILRRRSAGVAGMTPAS